MCNCNTRPCSCPNTNCGCPPNYSFNPALNTCQGTPCQDTLPTACIFSSAYLSCTNLPTNTDLQTILTAMDAKICQCGSCSGTTSGTTDLPLFYVDSHNTVNGDGSIINPFKTIDLAYNKIIGSGSTSSPAYPNAIAVVFGGNYTTSQNIYVPTTYWHFLPGSKVNYTGTTYFIDSSVVSDGAANFVVTGYLEFQSTTGGLLQNFGSYTNTSTNKYISIEVQSAVSSSATKNCIAQVFSGKNQGTQPITTYIKLQNEASIIESAIIDTIYNTGGIFHLNLNGGQLGYGIDLINGGYTGTSTSNIFSYYNMDNTAHNYSVITTIKNGYVWSVNCGAMIYIEGIVNYLVLENLTSISKAPSQATSPTYFLEMGVISISGAPFGSSTWTFLLKDITLDPNSFNQTTTNVKIIYYPAVTFDYLEMQKCMLYEPLKIDSNLNLSFSVTGAYHGSAYNIINGQINFRGNLPSYATNALALAGGLSVGDLYVNFTGTAKILQIVY